MGRKWQHRRDDGGSMLATVIVIVIGTGVCSFVVVMADSRHSDLLLGGLFIAAFLVLFGMLWYRYSRGDNTASRLAFWNAAARNTREEGLAAQYRPAKVEDKRTRQQPGTNKPITAEEAHNLQMSSSKTWVPSKAQRKKK